MKRFLTIFLLVSLMLSLLAGCGAPKQEAQQPTGQTQETPP